MLDKLLKSLKYIKLKDIVSVFIFIMILLPSQLFKLYLKINKKNLYLICEDKNEACDNGFVLYKYIRDNYPRENIYYAINYKSNHYKKVKPYKKTINFGSLKHWIYYLAATKNISSHKNGNPAPPLFYVLHVFLNLFNNRIFLQHGITQNDAKWLYYKNTKFKNVICAAKPEYEYFKNKFGYPENNLKYLGFPRFDNLDCSKTNKKQIVIMPTWRHWLSRETNFLEKQENFVDTEYFKKYNSLINNKKIINFIEKENISLIFFPHRNMQKFVKYFKINSKNVKILTSDTHDIQKAIVESALMITDYSSVAMDFAFMKKPILYYQFDEKEFRERQYQEGYYSYEKNGFGPVITEEDKLIMEVINIYKNDYKTDPKFIERIDNFFEINDKSNCERNYQNIKE